MTSISNARSKVQHAASSIPIPSQAQAIAQVVGLTCWLGFLLDMLVLSFPLNLGNGDWRIGLLQQLGDRSIVLLIGSACLLFANLSNRKLRKPVAFVSLSVGIFFLLSSVVAIRDGVALNSRTLDAISSQVTVIQEQIDKVKLDASIAPNLSSEQMEQAERELKLRSEALQKQAKVSSTKRSIASVGNLLVSGVGLILLGRVGARTPRRI